MKSLARKVVRVEEGQTIQRPDSAEMKEARDSWGQGPWKKEPDECCFVAHGFPCMLLRISSGTWCGYVRVTDGHPWYRLNYENINRIQSMSVHGGLTFAGEDDFFRSPADFSGFSVELGKGAGWWIGFDANHTFDYSPSTAKFSLSFRRNFYQKKRYKTMAWMKRETTKLAEQAKVATKLASKTK